VLDSDLWVKYLKKLQVPTSDPNLIDTHKYPQALTGAHSEYRVNVKITTSNILCHLNITIPNVSTNSLFTFASLTLILEDIQNLITCFMHMAPDLSG
jgi:hypothetical protein